MNFNILYNIFHIISGPDSEGSGGGGAVQKDKMCHSLKFITQPVVIEPKPFNFGYKS